MSDVEVTQFLGVLFIVSVLMVIIIDQIITTEETKKQKERRINKELRDIEKARIENETNGKYGRRLPGHKRNLD